MARRRPAEPSANPARGAALVVVAVVVGLFLLRNGLDTSEAVTSDPSEQGSDSAGSTDGGTDDGTDEGTDEGTDVGTDEGTETPTVREPGEVPTIVLNGTSVAGTAKKYSDHLAGAGYQLTNPDGANDDADEDAAITVIYFAPEFEAEAAAVALAIGAPASVVPEPLPTTPPGPIAGASVVVVIGLDLANVTPTAAAGATTTTTTAAAAN